MNQDDTNHGLPEPTETPPMPESHRTEPEPPKLFCYSLVLAEVIFQTEKGVASQRCQMFSKADGVTFPAARLGQLQNACAHQVQEQVQAKTFKALEVILLNILPLGWMSDEEFWGAKENIPGAQPGTPVQDSSNNTGVVVPMRRT